MIKRLLLAALLLASGTAHAQLYSKFGPVTGVLKGNVSTPQTSAAASTDIIGLWTGCTGANFLRGDGTCATPAGTGVTSVGLTAPSWYTVTGSPVTGSGTLAITAATGQAANRVIATPDGTTGAVLLRALVAGDIPPINLGSTANGGVSSATILLGTNGGTSNGFFSVVGPATSLKTYTLPNASATILTTNAAVTVAQGGTGLATLTANGVLLGEGTGNISPLVMGADTVLRGTASADPVAAAIPNCGSGTTALNYSTSTHAFGCQTISTGAGTVTSLTGGTGVTASPGTITSTGSFAVDQSFSPTWTGTHLWQQTNAGTFDSIFQNSSTGVAAVSRVDVKNSADALVLANTSTLFSGAFMTGGTTGESANIETNTVTPVNFGVGGGARITLGTAVSGRQVDFIGTTGTSAAIMYFGLLDQAGTRYGYWGKSSAGSLISYESDADVSLIANNGTDSLNISTAHKITYNAVPVIDVGTFTMTYNGFTSPPGLTATYTQAGKMVTLIIPGSAVAASNATTFTGTGIPAAIQPTQTQQLSMYPSLCEDNGVIGGFTCGASISGGTITFQKNGVSAGWTNSGQKGVTSNLTVTYLLN